MRLRCRICGDLERDPRGPTPVCERCGNVRHFDAVHDDDALDDDAKSYLLGLSTIFVSALLWCLIFGSLLYTCGG